MPRRAAGMEPLAGLTRRRWAIPVLGACLPKGESRFVILLAALKCSREALSATLVDLVAQGWLRRQTGFGHPLRPEYFLTRPGVRIAPACKRMVTELDRAGVYDLGLRKWSLPILLVVVRGGRGGVRFNALKAALPGVTVRAMALALRQLCAAGLVDRDVDDAFPRIPRYSVTMKARRVAGATRSLERAVGLRITRQTKLGVNRTRPAQAPDDPRVAFARRKP